MNNVADSNGEVVSDIRFKAGRTLVAGALSGAVAKTAVAPFDRTKILMQVSQMFGTQNYSGGVVSTMSTIWRTEGVLGFFRGNSATVARIMPYAAIQYQGFEFYNRLLAVHIFSDPESKSPLKRFVAGSMAGLTSVLCTYPIDLARTKLAVETSVGGARVKNRGIVGTLSRVFRADGFSGLFRGAYPTLVGVVPYAGISFLSFGVLKRECVDRGITKDYPTVVNMACGGCAGLAAQCATYPLDMVRRRLQALHTPAKMTRSERLFFRVSKAGASRRITQFSIRRSILWMLRTEGVAGLYRGVSLNFVKTLPAMAISFTMYDRIRLALGVPPSKYSATSG